MLCVYNPLPVEVTKTLRVNLYYTGLTPKAEIHDATNVSVVHELGRDHSVDLAVKVPAHGMSWYVIRAVTRMALKPS